MDTNFLTSRYALDLRAEARLNINGTMLEGLTKGHPRGKATIEAQLNTLPQVDLAEVELALDNLAKPWRMCNTGGYYVSYPMAWERRNVADGNWRQDMPRKLTDEQAHFLRETLLKLKCRIIIRNRDVFISGSLPLTGVRANEAAS